MFLHFQVINSANPFACFLLQKSEHLIKHIVSSEAVQPEVLKYLFRSLLNVGKVLNQNKLVKEVLTWTDAFLQTCIIDYVIMQKNWECSIP